MPARTAVFTFTFLLSRTRVSRRLRFSISAFKLILVVIFFFSSVPKDTPSNASVVPKPQIADPSVSAAISMAARWHAAAVLSDRITSLTNRIAEDACGIIGDSTQYASRQRYSHRPL